MDEELPSIGAFGPGVADLHRTLVDTGVEVAAAEITRHFFGPSTRGALQEYQRRLGLPATGRVDAATHAALAATLASHPPGVEALRSWADGPSRRFPGLAGREVPPPEPPGRPPVSGSSVDAGANGRGLEMVLQVSVTHDLSFGMYGG